MIKKFIKFFRDFFCLDRNPFGVGQPCCPSYAPYKEIDLDSFNVKPKRKKAANKKKPAPMAVYKKSKAKVRKNKGAA